MNTLAKKLRLFGLLSMVTSLVFGLASCNQAADNNDETTASVEQKIGVLLVNHGSRSETWRKALFQLEDNVRDQILADGSIKGVKTAHMEYTEPSIASRMKEFDKEGYTDVIIIPIFLTVSPHPFEDIPTIIGQKSNPESVEELRMEKIERYTPKAKTYITPLLDFTNILQKNILRRAKALSKDAANEGIVLIGYGDVTYDKEWGQLFAEIAKYTTTEIGISEYSYGWCGHIVHYDPNETTKAINKVLEKKKTALVIPVLVAVDENFQNQIITDGIKKVKNNKETVIYKPDAILQDPNIEEWILDISKEYAQKIKKNTLAKK